MRESVTITGGEMREEFSHMDQMKEIKEAGSGEKEAGSGEKRSRKW